MKPVSNIGKRYKNVVVIFAAVCWVLVAFLLLAFISAKNTVANVPNLVEGVAKFHLADKDSSSDSLVNTYRLFLKEQEIISGYQESLHQTQQDYLRIQIYLLRIQLGTQRMIDEGERYNVIATDIKSLKKLLASLYESDSFLELYPLDFGYQIRRQLQKTVSFII